MSSTRLSSHPYCRPGRSQDLLADRASFLHTIRSFFVSQGFLEVETPVLIPCADPSPHLQSFRTHYLGELGDTREQPLFLRTSPEFAMKELVTAGYERIFQICKFFRNGEVSALHNPEFTGLEWYAAGHDYTLLIELTEAMILALLQRPVGPDAIPSAVAQTSDEAEAASEVEASGVYRLTYQGQVVDLSPPWERLTVHEAIARHADVHLPTVITHRDLADACRARALPVDESDAWDDLFFKLFLTFVEPKLGLERPTFLFDYPIQMAALSRAKPTQPALAERVELYIAGLELANGYSELVDPAEQRRRWVEEASSRQAAGDFQAYPVDPGLLEALEAGMPPTAGIAVGLDRLLMLLRDAASIEEVLPFPMVHTPHPYLKKG